MTSTDSKLVIQEIKIQLFHIPRNTAPVPTMCEASKISLGTEYRMV